MHTILKNKTDCGTMENMEFRNSLLHKLDQKHVLHPYAALGSPCFPVKSANGCDIRLEDGQTITDGMSSWWACIHGYNHPILNRAVQDQLAKMSHVMFGGLTHEPAVMLAKTLSESIPANNNRIDKSKHLDKFFFCDSGSVSIEVAMKMALQYHYNLFHSTTYNSLSSSSLRAQPRNKFLTIRGGYHGDTFKAMSICDPKNGMHHLFQSTLTEQFFCSRPEIRYGHEWNDSDIEDVAKTMEDRNGEIAAVVLEPIVQGAGGMWFYSPEYLRRIRELCDQYNILLIFDEIATGFGRTGTLFAMDHAEQWNVIPDILCVGKALSGGVMSFAATITSRIVSDIFSHGPFGVLMHGPTFMGNPLCCAASLASLSMLKSYNLPSMIGRIERQLRKELEPCRNSFLVRDVRVLGAIGVVEMKEPIDTRIVQPKIVQEGVWLRPYGKLLYTMPPFIIQKHELRKITKAMVAVATGRLS